MQDKVETGASTSYTHVVVSFRNFLDGFLLCDYAKHVRHFVRGSRGMNHPGRKCGNGDAQRHLSSDYGQMQFRSHFWSQGKCSHIIAFHFT